MNLDGYVIKNIVKPFERFPGDSSYFWFLMFAHDELVAHQFVAYSVFMWPLGTNVMIRCGFVIGIRPTRELEVGRREARGAATRELGGTVPATVPPTTPGTASIASPRTH